MIITWRSGALLLVACTNLTCIPCFSVSPASAATVADDGKRSPGVPPSDAARPCAAEAERAFSKGNFKTAESLYRQAIQLGPDNPKLLISLAAVETRLGNLDESQTLLRQALHIDLNNGPAWLLLGMNALEQKQDEEAFADLVQAALRDDQNPRAHNYLGMAAGRKGWTEASEQELRRAVELDPGYADANFNLAVLYLRRTPPLIELARRHYQRAIDLGVPRDQVVEALFAKAIVTPSPSPSLH